ncbi:MAG: peptide deformylase [Planctomycetaceae bacterium]|nr:peptide deformylase [Planctomycetaceae bacterium]
MHRSKPLRRVDAELRGMIAEMFDLMYAHKGVGLAANQVDLPYRFFIVNPTGDAQQKSEERVFINPVLTMPRGSVEDEEGCLSLPGLYAPVRRPERIHVNAYDLSGNEIDFEATGLMSRVVQHESDHLDGVMFIDRVSPMVAMEIRDEVELFVNEFMQRTDAGQIPSEQAIKQRLAELEAART